MKHTGKTIDMYRDVRGCQLKLPRGKKQGPWLRRYAVARRAKPKAWAKGAGPTVEGDGKPGSIRRTGVTRQPLVPGKTPMRALSTGQDLPGVGGGTGEGSVQVELSSQTVWLRTPLSQARRMPQRGQSFHRTGARGSGAGAFSQGSEESEREAASGHNTALTRRGLSVVLLS